MEKVYPRNASMAVSMELKVLLAYNIAVLGALGSPEAAILRHYHAACMRCCLVQRQLFPCQPP